jgi:hypothetical protein
LGVLRCGATRSLTAPGCHWRCTPKDAGPRRQPAHHRRGHYVAGDVAVSAAIIECLEGRLVPRLQSCCHIPLTCVVRVHSGHQLWRAAVRRDSVPDCSWRCAPQDAVPRQQPAHQHRGHYVAGDVAVSAALHYRVGRVSLGAAPAAASPSPASSACTVGIYRLGRAAVRRDSVPDCSWLSLALCPAGRCTSAATSSPPSRALRGRRRCSECRPPS